MKFTSRILEGKRRLRGLVEPRRLCLLGSAPGVILYSRNVNYGISRA